MFLSVRELPRDKGEEEEGARLQEELEPLESELMWQKELEAALFELQLI